MKLTCEDITQARLLSLETGIPAGKILHFIYQAKSTAQDDISEELYDWCADVITREIYIMERCKSHAVSLTGF